MIIIIDGYNLLKQIFPGIKENLEKQKEIFIQELAFYKKKKEDIKEIVVVFDGGLLLHATREIRHGIVVIHSGARSSADDWIIHFVDRNHPKQILVITLDRELRNTCKEMGSDNLSIYDFYQIMQQNIQKEAQSSLNKKDTDFRKFENQGFDDLEKLVDNKALDLLMQEASIRVPQEKIDDDNYTTRRRGKSYTPSKKEKKLKKKLKKII